MSLKEKLKEKLLTFPSELVGEKIAAVKLDGYPDTLYLRFSSGNFAMVGVELFDNDSDLSLKDEVYPWDDFSSLVEIGVMTQSQKDDHNADLTEKQERATEKHERAQLTRLQAKYIN